MGKKKVNIDGQPLQSITIGKIKPPKFVLFKALILCGIFFAVVYYMDDVNLLINKYVLGVTTTDPAPTQTPSEGGEGKEEEPGEEPKKVVSYVFNETTDLDLYDSYKIFINDINLSEDGILTFTVSSDNETVDVTNAHLFFILYTEDNQPIKYIRLTGTVMSGVSLSKSYNVSSAARFGVEKLKEEEYPVYALNVDENGNLDLTCKKNTETIVYSFKEDKLKEVSLSSVVSKTDPNYDNLYTTYNDLYVNNKNKRGVTGSFGTSETELLFTFKVDYTQSVGDISGSRLFYSQDASPYVVMFELQSEFYNCQ